MKESVESIEDYLEKGLQTVMERCTEVEQQIAAGKGLSKEEVEKVVKESAGGEEKMRSQV